MNSVFSVFACFIKFHLPQLLVMVHQRKVALKCSMFWALTPCSPLKVNRSVGGTCHLHLQDGSISEARN
jgi:hypothetical protein